MRLRTDVLWGIGWRIAALCWGPKIAHQRLIKLMHTYCCQDLIKHAGEMHKDTKWHRMKRENINLSGKQISSRALIDSWKRGIDAVLLVHAIAWAHRKEQVQRCKKVEVGLCECWPATPGLGHVHNNRPFLCPFSLPEMLRWLSLQLKPSVHQRLSLLCVAHMFGCW